MTIFVKANKSNLWGYILEVATGLSFLRGFFAAISLTTVVTSVIDISAYEFLRGLHAVIRSWEYVAHHIGIFFGIFPWVPELNIGQVNALIVIMSVVIPGYAIAPFKTWFADIGEGLEANNNKRRLNRNLWFEQFRSFMRFLGINIEKKPASENKKIFQKFTKYWNLNNNIWQIPLSLLRPLMNLNSLTLVNYSSFIILGTTGLIVTFLLAAFAFHPKNISFMFIEQELWISLMLGVYYILLVLIPLIWIPLTSAFRVLPSYKAGLIFAFVFIMTIELLYFLKMPYLRDIIIQFSDEVLLK